MSDRESQVSFDLRADESLAESSSIASSASYGSNVEYAGLPSPFVEFYEVRQNRILGVDGNDMRILFNHEPTYLIEETLGRGSFGSVHRAQRYDEAEPEPEPCAIKILKVGVGNADVDSIPLERQIVQLLMPHSHQNVVTFYENFYGFFPNNNLRALYIISELSTVGDLFHSVQTLNPQGILVSVPLKEGVARLLIKGIANGIRHMKTLNMCHGDLKLENILLFDRPAEYPMNEELDRTRIDRWIPKLTDFGNSRVRDQSDPPGKLLMDYPLCTIQYASPESWLENADGSGNVFDTYSADVYSLGACLITLLLGTSPFKPPYMQYPRRIDPEFQRKLRTYTIYCNGIKNNESYVKHLCKTFSHPLRQLLLKALNPNPEQRITVEQFLTDPFITTHKSYESENVASRPAYGISPTFKGKGFAKDI